ncbi:MAG: fatty acid desaturase [Bdellovibrionales bacterium]|nr:fatty acid desaturase [Bdellovibrionales bacterium]
MMMVSFGELDHLRKEFQQKKRIVPYFDLLVTGSVCLGAAVAFLLTSYAWLALVIGSFAAHRASVFTHEINHGMRRDYRFRVIYQLIFGAWFRQPSYLYDGHGPHHHQNSYGTKKDARYSQVYKRLARTLLQGMIFPVLNSALLVVHYSLYLPGYFNIQPFLKWSKVASAFSFNPEGRGKVKSWSLCKIEKFEVLSTALVTLSLIGFSALYFWVFKLLLFTAIVGIGVFALDFVHYCMAHLYTSGWRPVSLEEQVLDSASFDGHFYLHLFLPLGHKYHSLHHLFPEVPYYNLGRLHKRLVQGLPNDHFYLRSVYKSPVHFFKRCWSKDNLLSQSSVGLS